MFEEQKACRTNSGLTTKQNVKTAARAGVARALPAYRESLPAGRLTAEYKHLNVSPELFNVSPPAFIRETFLLIMSLRQLRERSSARTKTNS